LCFHFLVTVNVNSFMSLGLSNTIQHSGSGETERQEDRESQGHTAGWVLHTTGPEVSTQPATITLSIVNMRMSSLDTPLVLHSFQWCLFMVYFVMSLGTSHSIVSNGTVTRKGWTAEDLEGNACDINQVLSQHVFGRTKEKHENQSGVQLYWPRFEMGT
jgi:hypothetical protein